MCAHFIEKAERIGEALGKCLCLEVLANEVYMFTFSPVRCHVHVKENALFLSRR